MNPKLDFERAKVLIVDDQRAFQVTLKGMLLNLGMKDIQFVESSDAAIRACRAKAFDIVLADYNLGHGKNGRQLLDTLREKRLLAPHTIFFIISGEATRGVVLGALEREPDDYMVKPFSLRQLSSRLQRAATKHQEMREVFSALHNDDIDLAIETCESLLKASSRYSSICIKILAEQHRLAGNLDTSEKLLRDILESRDILWARVSLGHTLNKASRHNEVLDLLGPVMKQNPLVVEAQDCLAEAYQAMDEGDKALRILRNATTISPFTSERQLKLANLARRQEEYLIAQEAFKQVFDLSQRAIEKNTEHMCNYVRATIEAALDTSDEQLAKRLETEVFNTLMRARQDAQYNGFDFQNYEDLVNAHKYASRGDLLRAKKLYYKATERYDNKSEETELPFDFLNESLNTVALIGELEEAQKLLNKAKESDTVNPFLLSTVVAHSDASTGVEALNTQFQVHSRQGMKAYDEAQYGKAIEEFEVALQVAPTNTGAALNLAQTLLKNLAEQKKPSKAQIKRCEELFRLVDKVRLPSQHRNRRKDLWQQLQQIQQGGR
ncbi:tetratricopeptide repeat-containing response regulator [Echinimonas agarilytica]|uniref:Response regulator n=1 Tax=Echinimonas agarilytica TaxID=1215918 RepID=A0AA41W927_9GAMM|nr:tetratricopeptide repeat-containing response regulator [Echinimonas agarilytica]MCM2680853.1 response regulator [Echinimonas agarilytica]